jgi:hypothetical protein
VTSASTAAMRLLGFDIRTVTANEPQTWAGVPSHQPAARVLKSVKVVNDVAERSVALMTSVNQSITRSESEMQKLLQVIEDDRQRVPDSFKSMPKSYIIR